MNRREEAYRVSVFRQADNAGPLALVNRLRDVAIQHLAQVQEIVRRFLSPTIVRG